MMFKTQMLWDEYAYMPQTIIIGNGFLFYSEETIHVGNTPIIDYGYRGIVYACEVSITWEEVFLFKDYPREHIYITARVDGKEVGGYQFRKDSHTDFKRGLKYAISCVEKALGISQEMTLEGENKNTES